MISHGVEISITRGGADEKDKGSEGFFSFFLFFFVIMRYLF